MTDNNYLVIELSGHTIPDVPCKSQDLFWAIGYHHSGIDNLTLRPQLPIIRRERMGPAPCRTCSSDIVSCSVIQPASSFQMRLKK